MKKRKITVSLLVFMLLVGISIPVYANEKKLYFEQQNGQMVWNADNNPYENQFMNFSNMVPGEDYQERMSIENGSSKTYELYFQVVLLEQTELQDELLEKIEMTILQDGEQIYQGDATGIPGTKNLQDIIPLGTYEPAVESTLNVYLKLDDNIGLEYCDLLTQIDWKFMVKEINKDTPITEIQPPKTGDMTNVRLWTFIMISSLVLLGIVNIFRKFRKYWNCT